MSVVNVWEYYDVIKLKQFPRYCSWSTMNSPHKGQWRGALMFSLIWANDWINRQAAGDQRRHCAHYDITVMKYDRLRTGLRVYLCGMPWLGVSIIRLDVPCWQSTSVVVGSPHALRSLDYSHDTTSVTSTGRARFVLTYITNFWFIEMG